MPTSLRKRLSRVTTNVSPPIESFEFPQPSRFSNFLADQRLGVTDFNVWRAYIFLLSQMSTNSVSVRSFPSLLKFDALCLKRDCHRHSGGGFSAASPWETTTLIAGRGPRGTRTGRGRERCPKHRSVASRDPYGRPIQCKCGFHRTSAPPAPNLVTRPWRPATVLPAVVTYGSKGNIS